MSAIQAYESQFQASGGMTALGTPEFIRFNQTKAAWFGAMVGVPFGEPYFSAGPLAVTDFPGLAFPSPPCGELPPFSIYA